MTYSNIVLPTQPAAGSTGLSLEKTSGALDREPETLEFSKKTQGYTCDWRFENGDEMGLSGDISWYLR